MTTKTGKDIEEKAQTSQSPVFDGEIKTASVKETKVFNENTQSESSREHEVVKFWAEKSNMMICIIQPEIIVKDGVKQRKAGFTARFENNFYPVDPDKVFEGGGIRLTGKEVINILRSLPRCGFTFWEYKIPQGKREDIPTLVARLRAMSDSEVRNQARIRSAKETRNMNKEEVILEIISVEMGGKK